MDEPVAPWVCFDQVTIGRNYYNHLLIRSDYYAPLDDTAPQGTPIPTVRITREEHEYLVKSAHEYITLRRHLLDYGMPLRTLDRLTLQGYPILRGAGGADQGSQPSPTHSDGFTALSSAQGQNSTPRTESFGFSSPSSTSSARCKHPAKHSMLESSQLRLDSPKSSRNIQLHEIHRQDMRSLQFSNLPRHTTHQDIADVVRGGTLVDIYIRWQDRSARVSYVQGSHAAAFKHHIQLSGAYVKGHRVHVDWAEDQFQIYGALAKKIKFGATRVLALRNAVGLVGEDHIRADMEHIHNLVIVNVKSCGHDVVIECSSIYAAEFARTCMMSRNPYRNFRIGNFPDGCAEGLPIRPSRVPASPPNTRPMPKFRNTYSVLALDDDCSSAEDDV